MVGYSNKDCCWSSTRAGILAYIEPSHLQRFQGFEYIAGRRKSFFSFLSQSIIYTEGRSPS